METKKIEMKQFNDRWSGAPLNPFRYTAMVIMLLTLGIGNAWAGASTTMKTTSTNTAQGLVYMTKGTTSAPDLSNYKETSDEVSQSTSSGGVANFIAWAKPARGFKFKTWADANGRIDDNAASDWPKANSNNKTKLNRDPSKWDGVHDTIQGGNGGQASTNYIIRAYFESAPSYDITYAVPVGGSYDIAYKYLTINSSTKFAEKTDNYSMTPTTAEAFVETSYAADVVTLTATGANFAGWYEGTTSKGTGSGTNHSYTYPITKAATITALFKTMSLGTAEGDLSPAVEVLGTMSPNPTITVPVTAHGNWSASDFTVTFTENGSRGDVTKGAVSYAQSSGNVLSSVGTLTIPFTYNPASWGNTEVNVTVAPKDGATYGNSISFTIKASATQVLNYEACILLEGETEPQSSNTGTLAGMVTLANSMSSKFTLQLAKDVTISSPLSLRKSMKFDLNDKKITSTGTSAFSIDAADVDVQIVDEGFGGLGEVATQSAQSGNVSVVTFTQKAKLTMQGGTLSAKNTGSGSAYGINVTQGSTFYMTNGLLTVTGVSEAQGVHVATASDYATFNGGSITVTAPSNAYGVWSAGQSNVTGATIAAETTTGANAYGVYVNGGISTLTTNTVSASAKTTGAYGAYVNAGRLNGNGGSFAAEAVTSGAYGVHVQAGATAVVQQNAVVTAEATGASGTSVFGVNNLGTVSLTNVSVTATSPTTAATAVNTATSAVSTTIEGGTYRANTTGGTAYGLHHQYGKLEVDGGEFRAVGGGADILGARVIVNANIANATLWGEAQGDGGNTAYGFKGDVAGKTISLTNCAIKGISNNNKAYAIYSNTNVTATGCTLTATATKADEAYGVYAANGTNQITNCDATVTVNTITAYGVKHVAGSLTIDGGEYNVTANQTSASGAQDAVLYGLHNAASQTTMVNGATFHANAANTAYSQNVYGALINGTLISTNGGYSARAKNKAYGIYGNTASTLTLAGNTVGSEITDGTVSYGIYAKKNFTINGDIVNAVGNKTGIYALFFDATNSVGEVLDGKFSAQGNNTNGYGPLNADGTTGKVKLKGGVAKTAANLKKYVVSGYDVYTLDNTHADYAAGYRYTIATENPSPYVCYIKNGNKYESLAAALQYTKDNSGNFIIVMTQNHTLSAGDYELRAGVTLIIPRNSSQTTLNTSVPKSELVGMVEEHLRLTLASGANLNVSGNIEVGGMLYSQESGKISYNNSPYARIYMESGSLIQLNDGARLYAWGFITGSGSITAKSGSEVHEMFQVGDMPAISPLGQYYLNNSAKYFPVQVYSIQNIEVPTTYYYNSQLITAMYEYNPGSLAHGWNGEENVKLIGKDGAMFLVTSNDESSWVRKSYSGGKQIYEVNSSAKLGSLSITVSSYTMDSRNYNLPITSNMKIHILDGNMEITQSTMFQPGSQVEINKTATLKINSTFKDASNYTQNLKVYLIDQDQWRTTTTNPDAAWNVHGKVEIEGKLFTTNKGTTTKSDGANIYSNNADAGTVSFLSAAASAETLNLVTGASGGLQTKTVNVESAKLKNNDGSYSATAGTVSGEAWIYLNNVWQKTYTNGCFEVIGSTVYAKPSGYVALKKSQTVDNKLKGVEESNYTYLTADDKILILMDECQWWEVVATSDPAVFECKKSGYEGFYFYNTSTSKWELKTVTVTFYQNETGSTVLKNIVTDYNGIPDQAVIATNPTKGTTAEYTYSFYGWKSSVEPYNTYKWTDPLEVATNDMSYRPVFTATKRNYTITLVNANNGSNVPLEVPYGETPEYTPKKDATAQYTYTFEGWSPAFTTVTGTATYTATWSSVVNEYNITWINGETVLEVDEEQPYGTVTAYNGATPTKAADDDYAYAFSGWHNSITNAPKANNETVTGAIIYTAQYNTTPRYAVTFNNYNGVQLDRIIYTQGETPAYAGVPTRKRDADGYFKFIGWKNSNGTDYAANATLPAVTKKETYTAQYEYVTDLFTITLNNVDGNGATWSGKFGEGAMPFYDPNEDDVPDTPSKPSDAKYDYIFTGWDPALETVTGTASYTAKFKQKTRSYTITWKNKDGEVLTTTQGEWGAIPAYPTVPYGTPTYTDGSHLFKFKGWSPAVDSIKADAEYTAQYDQIDNLVVSDDQTITINATVTTTTVKVDGKLNVAENKTLSTDDLILEATPSSSGEITGAGTVTAKRAYFDFSNGTNGFKAKTWYAVAVPWQVAVPAYEKANNGVYIKKGDGEYVQQELGLTFDLIYYDGARRATGANKAWNYVEDDQHERGEHDKMKPGLAYMIYLTSDADVIRFEKTAGVDAQLLTTQVEIKKYAVSKGVNPDYADWNGIANPATYHAYLNIGTTENIGQVYIAETKQYEQFKMSEKQLVVGQPIFVQPLYETTIKANASSNEYSPVLAPRRVKEAMTPFSRYEFILAPSEADETDRIIVRMSEDKEENDYVVGQDLVKMGVSDCVPQMWIDRYDSKMCINTVAPINNTADYPLGISVQKDGEYDLFIDDQPNDETMLYLTYDGEAIWNLSYGGYVATLTKGTNTHYGLRIVYAERRTPTGIEETTIQNGDDVRKVLVGNQVFIIRNNNIYTIDGQLVK